MNGFMLDTDIASYAIKGHPTIGERLLIHRPSSICISSIAVAELTYGAERLNSSKLQTSIDRFIGDIKVLPFDYNAAVLYGKVAAALARQGSPIGEYDTLIAAHALSAGMTLVTNNIRHFSRVAGLKTENWV